MPHIRHLPAVSLVILLACSESPEAPSAPMEPATATAAESVTIPSFVQVSGGNEHSCGLTPASRVLCWGVGMFGDGNGFIYDPRPPVPVYGNRSFRQVSSGYSHTCALTADNHLFCWGRNFFGELGDGTLIDRVKPTRIGGTRLFRQVDAGRSHTCAIAAADNQAWCWGDNTSGKLGDGTTTDRLAPVLVAGGRQLRQIAVGDNHTCAITTAGKAFCWGSDQTGQIGNGAGVTNRTTPTAVSGSVVFRQLASMWDHTCGVTAEGRAYCWGSNLSGQLGDGSRTTRFAPRQVAGGVHFDRVSVGAGHSCGESAANQAWCWGANNQGQLGDGTRTDRLTPAAVTGGIVFAQVSTGSAHTCGVATNGVAYCWGWNQGGQLGDGTIASRSTPVPVSQTDGVHRASTTVIETDDPDPSAPGSPVTVRYAVLSDPTIVDGRAPTGQVAVTGGADSCTGGLTVSSVGTVTVARGSCTLTLGTAGQVTLSATYSGDETFFGSSDSETHLVQ